MSMARLAFPSRLELKSLAGSFKEAPLKKVSFTIDLYDSPVQMMPSCDQIGVPIHFHSSTTSGSASLMSLRILPRVSPRQSPSSAILFEMSSDADWPRLAPDFFMFSSYTLQYIRQYRRRRRQRPRPLPGEQHLPDRPPADEHGVVLSLRGGERVHLRQLPPPAAQLHAAAHPPRGGHVAHDAAPRPRALHLGAGDVADSVHAQRAHRRVEGHAGEDP